MRWHLVETLDSDEMELLQGVRRLAGLGGHRGVDVFAPRYGPSIAQHLPDASLEQTLATRLGMCIAVHDQCRTVRGPGSTHEVRRKGLFWVLDQPAIMREATSLDPRIAMVTAFSSPERR